MINKEQYKYVFKEKRCKKCEHIVSCYTSLEQPDLIMGDRNGGKTMVDYINSLDESLVEFFEPDAFVFCYKLAKNIDWKAEIKKYDPTPKEVNNA